MLCCICEAVVGDVFGAICVIDSSEGGGEAFAVVVVDGGVAGVAAGGFFCAVVAGCLWIDPLFLGFDGDGFCSGGVCS